MPIWGQGTDNTVSTDDRLERPVFLRNIVQDPIPLQNPLFIKFGMMKIIDPAENVDCGAIVSEKFWHHFWQKGFAAESKVKI